MKLNSNEWLIRKKVKFFLELKERASILCCLGRVISFDDFDESANDSIYTVMKKSYITFIFGGFDKKNSSSKLLKECSE